MTALCHPLNLQICNKKVSEGVGSADCSVAAGLAVPLEAGERLMPSRVLTVIIGGSVGRASLCGFVGIGMRWGAGRTQYSLVFF